MMEVMEVGDGAEAKFYKQEFCSRQKLCVVSALQLAGRQILIQIC